MKGLGLLIIGGIVLFAIFGGRGSGSGGGSLLEPIITKVQPPVQISLTPYLVFDGYYVDVANTSATEMMTDVVVIYTGTSGNTKRQRIGILRPEERRVLDPSDVNWKVVKYESIGVSANGYLTKTLETNALIDQLPK